MPPVEIDLRVCLPLLLVLLSRLAVLLEGIHVNNTTER